MWNVQGFSCKQLVENLIGWINREGARSNQPVKIINQANAIEILHPVTSSWLHTLDFVLLDHYFLTFRFQTFLLLDRSLSIFNVHFDPWPSIPARKNTSLSSWAVRLQIRHFGGSQLRSKRRGIQSFRISIRHNRSKLAKNTIKNNHLFRNEIIKIVILGCLQMFHM